MINFQSVTKIYAIHNKECPITALSDISFEVAEKEFISVVGKSGAGKTTLLKLLLAEEKPTSGKVLFEGQNVHKIRSGRLPFLRRKIGVVFQDYRLLSSKTVFENIAYALEVIGASDEEVARDVPQILEIVELEDRANNYPEELSGGETQRAAIARALIHRPDVILADEPTGNLDPYNTLIITRLLIKIHEMGTTIILATHNKGIVNKIGKRVITLDSGKLVRDDKKGKFLL